MPFGLDPKYIFPDGGATNYVARLNGTGQQWNLTAPIQTSEGDYFTFDISASPDAGSFGDFKRIIGSDSNYTMTTGINAGAEAGVFIVSLSQFVLGGVNRTSGGSVPHGAGMQSAIFTPQEPTSIQAIGGLATLAGRSCAAAFKNFRHYNEGGALLHEIPLNRRGQGATQEATVGAIGAVMAGYDAGVWEEDT